MNLCALASSKMFMHDCARFLEMDDFISALGDKDTAEILLSFFKGFYAQAQLDNFGNFKSYETT